MYGAVIEYLAVRYFFFWSVVTRNSTRTSSLLCSFRVSLHQDVESDLFRRVRNYYLFICDEFLVFVRRCLVGNRARLASANSKNNLCLLCYGACFIWAMFPEATSGLAIFERVSNLWCSYRNKLMQWKFERLSWLKSFVRT